MSDMRRALYLAALGRREVKTHPMVGCVLVGANKEMLAEGWHTSYGAWHAEREALNCVRDSGKLKGATAYINLEPCCHQGKTPPCTEALIAAGIGRVYIAMVDPHRVVEGKGIAQLQQAGIEVHVGLCGAEARALNVRYLRYMQKKKPYVVLKWAQSQDGYLAPATTPSRYGISHPSMRRLAHLWRGEEMGVMVGYRTAEADDPRLDVRQVAGRDPCRVVFDRDASLNKGLKLWDQQEGLLVYTSASNPPTPYIHVNSPASAAKAQALPVPWLLNDLYQRGCLSLLVEGGTATLRAFLDTDLWDEARVIISPQRLERGLPAPPLSLFQQTPATAYMAGDELHVYYASSLNSGPPHQKDAYA